MSDPRKSLIATGLALLGALTSSCVRTSAAGTDQLHDLKSIQDLEARFNQDQGTPRLILLLSPT
jgi:outer membrane lipoprotein-sorting protein